MQSFPADSDVCGHVGERHTSGRRRRAIIGSPSPVRLRRLQVRRLRDDFLADGGQPHAGEQRGEGRPVPAKVLEQRMRARLVEPTTSGCAQWHRWTPNAFANESMVSPSWRRWTSSEMSSSDNRRWCCNTGSALRVGIGRPSTTGRSLIIARNASRGSRAVP